MRSIFTIILLIISVNLLAQLNSEQIQELKSQKATSFSGKNSHLVFDILCLKNSDGFPIMYQSVLKTPVCDDTLCQIVELNMYWDLTGKYLGFTTITDKPLTKFDHIKFTRNDYSKLQQLLSDNNSVLQRKKKVDLLDKNLKRESQKYDAVTGATALEIKNAVVEGALYTSFTLWHLAHDEARYAISKYTKEIIDTELLQKMLISEKPNYQLFALQLFDKLDFDNYRDDWIDILRNGIPLNRHYLLKKIPPEIWQDESIQINLAKLIPQLDRSSITLLLEGFKRIQHPSKLAIKEIRSQRGKLSRNQRNLLATLSP